MRNHKKVSVALLLFSCSALAHAGYDSYSAKYKVGVNLPSCNASSKEVKIISKASDLSALNSSAYRVFCVKPGNYPSVTVTTSGTASKKRVLRYMDSSSVKPWTLSGSKRAVFSGLTFMQASHWIVDGLSFSSPKKTGDTGVVKVVKNSDNIVLNRLHVYDAPITLVVFNRGSDNNVLQNSVLEDTHTQAVNCIQVQASIGSDSGELLGVKNLRIVNNEIFNCSEDGMQVLPNSTSAPKAGVEGLVFENNDVYITNAKYTDCKGRRTQSGSCACAENAVDFKVGNTASQPNSKQLIRILHNRFWGFRKSDRGGSQCAKGNSSGGFAVVMHHSKTDGIEISQNIIVDVENGIAVPRSGPNSVSILDNIIYDSSNKTPSARKGAISLDSGVGLEVYFNHISNSDRYLHVSSSTKSIDVRGNTFINGGEPVVSTGSAEKRAVRVQSNNYVGTKPVSIDKNGKAYASVGNVKSGKFCFKRKRQTRSETYCVPSVSVPTVQQSAAAGQVSGVGIDNATRKPSSVFWGAVNSQTR